ncbi:acyl-CoA synthetase, partial [Mycobacteroides abscessus subsp. abscessus]
IPPMIHGATQAATFMALFQGRTTVLAPEFNPEEVWELIEKHKINMLFFAGDAIARPLIDALDTETGRARDLSSLWVLASSAALFSQTVKERYLELL